MTEQGFIVAMNFLEGAFRTKLAQNERDAYWIILRDRSDEDVLENARDYCLSEQSRFGFPKPVELAQPRLPRIGDFEAARALTASAEEEAKAPCQPCGGTGFRIVERAGSSAARACLECDRGVRMEAGGWLSTVYPTNREGKTNFSESGARQLLARLVELGAYAARVRRAFDEIAEREIKPAHRRPLEVS